MNHISLVLTALVLFCAPVFAEDDREHDVIKGMPGSQIEKGEYSKVENYGTHQFKVRDGHMVETVEKSGTFYRLRYFFYTGEGTAIDRARSREEIQANYKKEALEKGGEIRYERLGNLVFTLEREDGGTTWAELRPFDGRYELYIINEELLNATLKFGAEQMQAALDKDGRVAVYGINFDVDKDTLKVGAEEVIVEIVKLLQNNESLALEIQGHTDNTGSADHNMDLSNRRAATVKKYLVLFGIDEGRLTTKGYGLTEPIADNSTDEGRAKNRRVELVRR